MIGMTLSYLNSLDKSNVQRSNDVAADPYESSTAAAYEFATEIREQNHYLAKVIEVNMAAQEGREAVGQIIDHLI